MNVDVSWQQGRTEVALPEELGRQAACALLEEVHRGGVADSAHQAWRSPRLALFHAAACMRALKAQLVRGHA
jgi:hypothetical protein